MGDFILFLVACFAGYICGAIPTAVILTQLLADVDLRKVGSGNCGFSNAARVLGWKLALIVLVADILKGYLPVVLFPRWLGLNLHGPFHHEVGVLLIAITPVIGHIYSIFLAGRGGKGVATSIGVYFALAPLPCLVALAAGALVVATTRFMSLASITGAIVMTICVPILAPGLHLLTLATAVMTALIIYLHRGNIQRLLNGTEPRFGQRISTPQKDKSSSKIFRKR
ncbi:MAG: glycerol-3-phosphate 1-O-acyltransferase PlsY [Candidatus Sumerlaeota bacterium]|nr:glycerol-3-phosphate 1-O-acyltransferase PlsY [Candidatus Sumerlaeota bacterium]